MTTVTVLHPGSMGAAVAAQAVTAGHEVWWVSAGRSSSTVRRAESAGLRPKATLESALRRSEVVLSVCPPHAAESVAHEVAQHGLFGGTYIDANAISPPRMERIANQILPDSVVLDGAIVGPPPTARRECRLYVAGASHAVTVAQTLFQGTSVHVRTAGSGDVGAASALKASFAAFQKAARTLAGVSYALADAHGVADQLREEAETMTSEILSDPDYLPSVAARAWRWAPEMLDVAEALRDADLPTELAEAAASVLVRWEKDKDTDLPLSEVFAHLKREGSSGK